MRTLGAWDGEGGPAWLVDFKDIDEQLRYLRRVVDQYRGVPQVRNLAVTVIAAAGAPQRDKQAQAVAVATWVQDHVYYVHELPERFQTPTETLRLGAGDCLPVDTLVLRSDFKLVPLGSLAPGDAIAADGCWTKVTEQWVTGRKRIFSFELNNGSVLRCSASHRLFLASGEEIRARSVRPGDRLLTPRQSVPCAETQSPGVAGINCVDWAWLLGVYVADGWGEERRFAISGLDGKPKEAQKRRVQQIVEAAGVKTRWHRKYIAVNDPDLAQRMHACGTRAPQKHLPDLAYGRAEVESLLEGLRADAGVAKSGTVVHGTTSPELALQLRVLYRMLGKSTHIRLVADHGGLGKNPIYRVTVRGSEKNFRPDARVVAVREEPSELCADITTESGRFWLPESDILVHNCDDSTVLVCSMLEALGIPSALCCMSIDGAWSHIFPGAWLQPGGGGSVNLFSSGAGAALLPLDTTMRNPVSDLRNPVSWAEERGKVVKLKLV